MSKKIPNIKDRILYFAENKEVSKQEFFRKTNLKYSNFTGKSKESDLNSKSVAEILLIYPEINPEWLLTGEGEMVKNDKIESPNTIDNLKNDQNSDNQPYINIKEYNFKLADLGMLLDDNMKMLYFISSILKKYNYKFTNKEKRELKFYEGLDGLIMNIRSEEEKITYDEFEHLSRIIKSSLFSFINGMMYKAEELLEMNTSFDFDEILKPN